MSWTRSHNTYLMHFLSTSFKFQLIVDCVSFDSQLLVDTDCAHMDFFSFLCIRVKQQQALNLVVDGRLFNHFYTSLCSSNVACCSFFWFEIFIVFETKTRLKHQLAHDNKTRCEQKSDSIQKRYGMEWVFKAKNEKLQRSHLTMMIFIMHNNKQNLATNTISTCTCSFIQLYCWWFFDAV